MLIRVWHNLKLQKQLQSGGKTYGELNVGGSFELEDTKGNIVTNDTLKGNWLLLYFGFTYCPDICPEQMEAMGELTDIANEELGLSNMIPVMVTIDPDRDTPEVIDEYLSDYHPKFLGLRGPEKNIDSMCKKFRVYRSKGQALDNPNDYILDHTVTQYLINPNGKVMGYFMRNREMQDRVETLREHFDNFNSVAEESTGFLHWLNRVKTLVS